MEGFIKLYRSLLDWEWYGDINTRLVFIHLLLNANWEDSKFKGIDIPKGSLIIGRKQLAEKVGITEQSIRTSLEHLKSTNEITIKTTNKFSVITIVNWGKYQGFNEDLTNKPTNKLPNNQPTTNQQLTTEEEYNNIINKESNNIGEKSKRFVPPTVEEVRTYCQERNNTVDPEAFIDFYESKGWYIGKNKVKDWRACVRTWERNRKPQSKKDDYSDYNDLDKLEKETREKSKNPYKNYIHGNYDFEQIERELREK